MRLGALVRVPNAHLGHGPALRRLTFRLRVPLLRGEFGEDVPHQVGGDDSRVERVGDQEFRVFHSRDLVGEQHVLGFRSGVGGPLLVSTLPFVPVQVVDVQRAGKHVRDGRARDDAAGDAPRRRSIAHGAA